MTDIANWITDGRKAEGLSRSQLAEKTDADEADVDARESGDSTPTVAQIQALRELIGTPESVANNVEKNATTWRSRQPPLVSPPKDLTSHAKNVRQSFDAARSEQDFGTESHSAYHNRSLFKFKTRDHLETSVLGSFGNVDFISEEDDSVFLAFVDEAAIDTFQNHLQELEAGGAPTRRRILWAIQEAVKWAAEDRTGFAHQAAGFPKTNEFVLDVESWPLLDDRAIRAGFQAWCDEREITKIDSYRSSDRNLLLYRVRATRECAEELLHHRDIRRVDLPPRYGLDRGVSLHRYRRIAGDRATTERCAFRGGSRSRARHRTSPPRTMPRQLLTERMKPTALHGSPTENPALTTS